MDDWVANVGRRVGEIAMGEKEKQTVKAFGTPPEALVASTEGEPPAKRFDLPTGPKGVAVEHRHLATYVRSVTARLGLPAGGGYATVSTIAADLGHTAVFPALLEE